MFTMTLFNEHYATQKYSIISHVDDSMFNFSELPGVNPDAGDAWRCQGNTLCVIKMKKLWSNISKQKNIQKPWGLLGPSEDRRWAGAQSMKHVYTKSPSRLQKERENNGKQFQESWEYQRNSPSKHLKRAMVRGSSQIMYRSRIIPSMLMDLATTKQWGFSTSWLLGLVRSNRPLNFGLPPKATLSLTCHLRTVWVCKQATISQQPAHVATVQREHLPDWLPPSKRLPDWLPQHCTWRLYRWPADTCTTAIQLL